MTQIDGNIVMNNRKLTAIQQNRDLLPNNSSSERRSLGGGSGDVSCCTLYLAKSYIKVNIKKGGINQNTRCEMSKVTINNMNTLYI